MIGDIITVNSRKFDGHIRRSWIGAIASESNGVITLIAEFSEAHEHSDLGRIAAGTISIEHFWTDRWYNVFHFKEPDGRAKASYANITMPARLSDGVIDYVDLDIDVVVWPDGRVDVLDRDDFEQNSAKYGYPPDVIAAAEDALSQLLVSIGNGDFPFNR